MDTTQKIYKSVLSFDIGVKNLSFCIIDIHPGNKYYIKEWGIINLIKLSNSI